MAGRGKLAERELHDPPPTLPAARPLGWKRVALITLSFAIVISCAAASVIVLPQLLTRLMNPMTGPVIAAPPQPIEPKLALRDTSADAPAPSPPGVTAALGPAAADPALAGLAGTVIDPDSHQTLWSVNPDAPMAPASTGKLLAMSAALLTLDPQSTLDTTVVAGPQPGSVVLVGGGDPTLSTLPDGKRSVYFGAAHLDDLVAQVKTAAGGPVTRVYLDANRYVDDGLGPGWLPGDVADGYETKPAPLMLDGARADPTVAEKSPRADQPALAAAREFAHRLGLPPTAVAPGAGQPGAKLLGKVSSPPIYQLVQNCLQISDNVLAENLAREVALKTGQPASFAAAPGAVRTVLANNGIDVSATQMLDGSGLSPLDKVTAKSIAAVLSVAAAGSSPDGTVAPSSVRLRPLLGGLPVGGGSGTLSTRFHKGPSFAGRGWVRAKTGTLSVVNSLAGVVTDSDGRLLVFTLLTNNASGDAARTALDTVASTLHGCGCH